MANLGILGAIAGTGKGIMENAKQRQEDASAERQSQIDEARERRLLEYKAQIDTAAREQQGAIDRENATHTGGIESTHIKERGAVQGGLNEANDTRQLERQDDAQTHDSTERQLDRESAERIAKERAQGSASEAEIKARERFEPRTATITTMGPNGFPQNQDVSTIYDKETRQTLVQQGNRFVPQGVDPGSVRPASAAAIDMLMADPSKVTDFLEFYNYIPSRFMETLSSERKR